MMLIKKTKDYDDNHDHMHVVMLVFTPSVVEVAVQRNTKTMEKHNIHAMKMTKGQVK